jgi:hypothetical protein
MILFRTVLESKISFLNKDYTSNDYCNFICKIKKSDGQNLWFRQLVTLAVVAVIKSIKKIGSSNNIYFGTSFQVCTAPFTQCLKISTI